MNCLECRRVLDEVWTRTDLPIDVGQHLRDCSTCALYRRGQEVVQGGLADLPRPQPSPNLSFKILGALQDEQRNASRLCEGSRYRWAVAASLLLAVGLGFQFLPTSKPLENGEVVVRHVPAPASERKAESPVDALASLSEKFVDESRQNLRIVLAAASPVDSFTKSDAGTPTLPTFEVPENLRSVGDSARRAFVFFSTEFPMLDIPASARDEGGEPR